jgi:flagellar assembly factor FliW
MNAPLRLDTEFGVFEVGSEESISFPSGVPGFEACRRFVLPTYRTVLSGADLVRLGASPDGSLLWLAIVTLEDATGQAHVNLRAPIVINPQMMVGYQLMPSNSLYPLRHPLSGD